MKFPAWCENASSSPALLFSIFPCPRGAFSRCTLSTVVLVEMRFPGCLVRLHQRRRSCQLHRVLQGDLESSDKDHDQHRFIGSLDMLAVGLELRELPVEIIFVHLESAEFFG